MYECLENFGENLFRGDTLQYKNMKTRSEKQLREKKFNKMQAISYFVGRFVKDNIADWLGTSFPEHKNVCNLLC